MYEMYVPGPFVQRIIHALKHAQPQKCTCSHHTLQITCLEVCGTRAFLGTATGSVHILDLFTGRVRKQGPMHAALGLRYERAKQTCCDVYSGNEWALSV